VVGHGDGYSQRLSNKTMKEEEVNNLLVSIIVVTYNSSKYIIETLNSVKNQTYKNIELIVTDDCSTDNTVALCRNWIDANNARFTNTILLTIEKNTGVSANVNRGYKVANGKWLKSLAGDDCLEPNAIEDYVRFAEENNCQICAAGMNYIDDNSNAINPLDGAYSSYLKDLDESYDKQLKKIYKGIFFPGNPLFFSKEVIEKTGGNDEKYPFADEWPFHYRILKSGYKICPLNRNLIRYRVHIGSLCRNSTGKRDNRITKSMRSFYYNVVLPDLLKKHCLFTAWHGVVFYFIYDKSEKYKYLLLLSPISYINKIKKILNI